MWTTNVLLNFSSSHLIKVKKKGKINFGNIFYLTKIPRILFQSTINIKALSIRVFPFFVCHIWRYVCLPLSLWNLLQILFLQRISIWTNHFSNLNSRMWQTATILTDCEQILKTNRNIVNSIYTVISTLKM